MSVNTNVILKKYLQDLILELKKLKAILEFENTKITQGIIDILEITNPKKDLIVNSINNYYTTINSWLKTQEQIQEEINKLIKYALSLKKMIYTQYENTYKMLKKIFAQKKAIPKIQFFKSSFNHKEPILLDVII
ncbi:hypothetical protein ACE4V3_01530 [Borrelia recurrentis]|uniref:Uncharacterized conserved protein n=1 Tax=Borrelia recurrentis (strain A1) TaxID=412418 RepID=B5RPP9_BORRA|nr:hypothetical protein [Borrelia recurrentis]ACH94783.1 uncharacterized conserved protein [Borrelia recurrentis A1]